VKHVELLLIFAVTLFGQDHLPPRFEDFPAPTGWKGPPMALGLRARSDAIFLHPLLESARQAPNFATHYRFTQWLCGSTCLSGAIVDLATGWVIDPPPVQSNSQPARFSLCQSGLTGSGVEVRPNSKLVIVRCGPNYNVRPRRSALDAYYFVFENQRFRKVAHLHRN